MMKETIIKWDGGNGTVVEDGSIEIVEKKAIEELIPVGEKLIEIMRKYGIVPSISTSVMSDGRDYVSIFAGYTKDRVKHLTTYTRIGDAKTWRKYIWKEKGKTDSAYDDTPLPLNEEA